MVRFYSEVFGNTRFVHVDVTRYQPDVAGFEAVVPARIDEIEKDTIFAGYDEQGHLVRITMCPRSDKPVPLDRDLVESFKGQLTPEDLARLVQEYKCLRETLGTLIDRLSV